MKKINVGLVGIGGMGYGHYLAYKEIKNAHLKAVCDIRIEELKSKIDDSSINIYKELDEMLINEDLDVIDIVTPSYLHAEMIIKCLSKGYNVLCEKPLALNDKEIEEIGEQLKKTNKKFMVAHVVRFMRSYIYLKDTIKSNELGKLIKCDFRRISTIPTWSYKDWMRNEKLSGGVGLDLSIHDLDFAQSIFGMPIDYDCTYRPISNNNSFIFSTLIYKDIVITCEGTWYNTNIPFMAEYLAVFENGFLKFKDGKLFKNNIELNLHNKNINNALEINISSNDAYRNEIQYFIDCVIDDKKQDYISYESSSCSVKLVNSLIKKAKII